MVAPIAGLKRRRPTKAATAAAVAAASEQADETPSSSPPPVAAVPPPPPPPPLTVSNSVSKASSPQPPPIVPDFHKRELVLNKLAAQKNSGILLDRDALLLSIRQGVNLRKIETKDKSGLYVDKELITDIKRQPNAPPPPCTG